MNTSSLPTRKKLVFLLALITSLAKAPGVLAMESSAAEEAAPARKLSSPQRLGWMHVEDKHEDFKSFVKLLEAKFSDPRICDINWKDSKYRGIIEEAAFAIFNALPALGEWRQEGADAWLKDMDAGYIFSILSALYFQEKVLESHFDLVYRCLQTDPKEEYRTINLLMVMSTVPSSGSQEDKQSALAISWSFMNRIFPGRKFQNASCLLGAQMWLRQAGTPVAIEVMKQIAEEKGWDPMNWREKIGNSMGTDEILQKLIEKEKIVIEKLNRLKASNQ